MDTGRQPRRVLVVFNTLCLYGMERAVIETFDLLRPEVTPHFLIQRSNERYNTGLLQKIGERKFCFTFFSDSWDWPRIGKPQSLIHLAKIVWSLLVANWDVFHASLSNDIIYLPAVSSAYLSFAACLYQRLRNKKVIYFFHDLAWKSSGKLKLAVWLATDLIYSTELSRRVVSVSNGCVRRKKSQVIPPQTEIRRTSHLETLPWRNKRNIVFAGRIAVEKGLDILLEAFKQVGPDYGDLVLHVAGGYDGECPPWFDQALRCVPNSAEIKYWGFLENIYELLRIAYLYVQPTPPSRSHEAFGRGVVEAMIMGVPALCFCSGALSELVVHGETGLLCQEESAHCLAQGLRMMLDDPVLRDVCGRQAKERYEQHYSSGFIHEAWLELVSSR